MDFPVVISILQFFCLFFNAVAVEQRASGLKWPSFSDFYSRADSLLLWYVDYDLYNIPETFDVREKWPMCKSVINQISYQGGCGSCWAVSTASMISDRICIASEGKKQIEISAEDILGCCKSNICKSVNRTLGGCDGGNPINALDYWIKEGIVSGGPINSNLGCKPYSKNTYKGISPTCKSECTNKNYNVSYENDKNYGAAYAMIAERLTRKGFIWELKDLQIDIMKYGPLKCGVGATQELKDFKGQGVFAQKDKSQKANPHSTIVVGWGKENETLYWLIRNTWKNWGDKGFAKILRGTNEINIERKCIAGYVNKPDFSSPTKPSVLTTKNYYDFRFDDDKKYNDNDDDNDRYNDEEHDNKKKVKAVSQSLQASVHLISLMALILFLF